VESSQASSRFFPERGFQPSDVLFVGADEDIEMSCGANDALSGHRHRTDEHIFDLIVFKRPQDADRFDKLHAR